MSACGYTEKAKIKIRLDSPLRKDAKQERLRLTRQSIAKASLHTVCQEAACPNLHHCWSQGTASFMILGKNCTRRCAFCNVHTGRPLAIDPEEPQRLAEIAAQMELEHIVITSVDRDDLQDGGSAHFADCIRSVRAGRPKLRIEALIPDFKGRRASLEQIWEAKPDIINHNVETVPSLYKSICPQSNYENSLRVLRLSTEAGFLCKSGIILGLGERRLEVERLMRDLSSCGVKLLTLGQYLQPSPKHAPLREYISMAAFARLKEYALQTGIPYVEAGPLVRSSYHAQDSLEAYYESLDT